MLQRGFPFHLLIAQFHTFSYLFLLNRKSHNGNIDSCWSTILIFLCFCPLGDLTARVRKMEKEKENEKESVCEHRLLSSGDRGHSVSQTFRQINLTRRMENSGEARSHSWKNHTASTAYCKYVHTYAHTHTHTHTHTHLLPTHSPIAD